MKQWYKKKPIPDSVLDRMKIDRILWDLLSDKVHEDDLEAISQMLGVTQGTITGLLYRECQPPGGVNGLVN